jgi:hypothetical protein
MIIRVPRRRSRTPFRHAAAALARRPRDGADPHDRALRASLRPAACAVDQSIRADKPILRAQQPSSTTFRDLPAVTTRAGGQAGQIAVLPQIVPLPPTRKGVGLDHAHTVRRPRIVNGATTSRCAIEEARCVTAGFSDTGSRTVKAQSATTAGWGDCTDRHAPSPAMGLRHCVSSARPDARWTWPSDTRCGLRGFRSRPFKVYVSWHQDAAYWGLTPLNVTNAWIAPCRVNGNRRPRGPR